PTASTIGAFEHESERRRKRYRMAEPTPSNRASAIDASLIQPGRCRFGIAFQLIGRAIQFRRPLGPAPLSITLAAAQSLLPLPLLRRVARAAPLPIIGCPDWHEMAPFERLPLWGLANVRVPLNDHPFYSFSLLLRRLCGVRLCRRIPGQSQSTQAGGV